MPNYLAAKRRWKALCPERPLPPYLDKPHRDTRTKRYGAVGCHTLEQRRIKFAELGDRCFYCGGGGKMTLDHLTPVSRGGTHNLDNIVPACRSCNSRKHTKTLDEFMSHF